MAVEGEEFRPEVRNKLAIYLPELSRFLDDEDRVAKMAVLKFVGEEYSNSVGLKKIYDRIQDASARSYTPPSPMSPDGKLPRQAKPIFPVSWRRGNKLQKALLQHDLLHHDVGPANINVASAAKLAGITDVEGVGSLAKYLATDAGTVEFSTKFVKKAQKELEPYIRGMSDRNKAQILVDFVRSGKERFWERVQANRKLSISEMEAWAKTPATYVNQIGLPIRPLEPNFEMFSRRQFDQIEAWLNE